MLQCAYDEYECADKSRCVPITWVCNGVAWGCSDGSDEICDNSMKLMRSTHYTIRDRIDRNLYLLIVIGILQVFIILFWLFRIIKRRCCSKKAQKTPVIKFENGQYKEQKQTAFNPDGDLYSDRSEYYAN